MDLNSYYTMTKKEELEAQGFKTYENEDIQVFWNPKMCEHAGECVRGNGKVLDRSAAYDRGKQIGECDYSSSGKEEFKDVM